MLTFWKWQGETDHDVSFQIRVLRAILDFISNHRPQIKTSLLSFLLRGHSAYGCRKTVSAFLYSTWMCQMLHFADNGFDIASTYVDFPKI